jgi:hypothetical protein
MIFADALIEIEFSVKQLPGTLWLMTHHGSGTSALSTLADLSQITAGSSRLIWATAR